MSTTNPPSFTINITAGSVADARAMVAALADAFGVERLDVDLEGDDDSGVAAVVGVGTPAPAAGEPAKRPRGRPRKNPLPAEATVSQDAAPEGEPETPPETPPSAGAEPETPAPAVVKPGQTPAEALAEGIRRAQAWFVQNPDSASRIADILKRLGAAKTAELREEQGPAFLAAIALLESGAPEADAA